MDEEEDILDSLLAAASEQLDDLEAIQKPSAEPQKLDILNTSKTPKKLLKETDIFQLESNISTAKNKKSVVHSGDTDSSDDEGNRNHEDQKYNECGREIKRLLNTGEFTNTISSSHYGVPKQRVSTWSSNSTESTKARATLPSISKPINKEKFEDVFLDPIFAMRIINPKISSAVLIERMQSRLAVRFSDISKHLFAGNLKDKDWVICGVLVSKSPPKTSQKGSQYSIWTLSDLKGDIKTVGLFMFSTAHQDLCKTVIGTVVGVLNPGVMDKRDGSKDEASLSVDSAQKVMIFGQSKDFGICKSVKKNGEKCTAIVNLSQCEYCIYHIKQEYQKCSKRSELQANFVGKGLTNLRNKVLGKNEVFYAGKSYMAIPAKKSKKLESKDNDILKNLSSRNGNLNNIVKAKIVTGKKAKKGMARHLDVNPAQRAKDLELLKKLGGTIGLENKSNFSGVRSDEISLGDSKAMALSVISKLKEKKETEESKCAATKRQYDIKGDLFRNVDKKGTFSGKMSNNVSLEESKNAALSFISKLNAKKSNVQENRDNEDQPLISLEEMEAELDCDELKYSDDDNDGLKKNEELTGTPKSDSTPLSKSHSKNGCNVEKSLMSLFNSPKSKNDSILSPKVASCTDTPKKSNKETVCRPLAQTSNSTKYNSPKSLSPKVASGSDTPNKPIKPTNAAKVSVQTSGSINFNSPKTSPKSKLSNNNSPGMTMGVPLLSGFGRDIDLSKPITSKHVDRAKMNAIKYIQRSGPIKKIDPNNTKSSGTKKRNIDGIIGGDITQVTDENYPAKKSKLQESEFISDRFKKMMAMTSKHVDLLEQHDNAEKEKYFTKLEVKEKMEEKMVNTHKVKCKAVRCLQCKYTSFSASDLCKKERHTLKVFDAMKRFYKCSNCQNRSVCLELFPTKPCNNCGSSKWQKTGMMKEKIAVVQHSLSIRGGEQKFVNADIKDANLDLLVPDD